MDRFRGEFNRKVDEFDRKLICDYLVPIVVSLATAIITFRLLH